MLQIIIKDMYTMFKEATKNFKKKGILHEDVANLLEMHGFLDTVKHINAVADEAKILATRFLEDQEEALAAGWLHDISVIFSNEDRLRVATELGIDILPEERIYPAILHQKISQVMAEEIFGITNKNILSAIGCHTTLKENASVLDKIVFISDKIKWDQDYDSPYLEDILKAMEISLDEACFCYLDYLWKKKESLTVVHPWMEVAHKQLANLLKR